MVKNNCFDFKFIDLFAGIGGFRIAAESIGGECVFSSEWDKHSQKTYEENFGEVPFGDITKISEKDIPKHDLICGGFPCQAFSISGKQMGFEDTRGTLFFEIARIAKHHKPKALLLENVKNFARHDGGKTLKTVTQALESLGYKVFHKILNASLYGAPTARERIFIVALRKDISPKCFVFPKPNIKNICIGDVMDQKVSERYFINRKDVRFTANEPIDDLFPVKKLEPIRLGVIGKGGQGERIYSTLGHAITLSAYGGGVAAKTGAYLHNNKIRKLTPRECARAMGYPESFKIVVSDGQAYKQFGNSVAVQVVKSLMLSIKDFL